jgi:thymidine kinase
VIPFLPARGGSLDVICGPMFSGKSEELLRRIRRAEIAQLSPLLFKPSLDDRYGETDVVSHAGSRLRCISIGSSADIEIHPELATALIVGIDEVQFLDDGIVEVALGLVRRGVRVLAAGLDRDFRGEPFGPMPLLLAHADDADKLDAICQICAAPATMTQRLVDGRPAHSDDPVILVGASDSYEARCRGCHRLTDVAAPLAAAG